MNRAMSSTFVDAIGVRTSSSFAVRGASVLFITALTAAAAQISVPLPFTQVPFTFQPMIVLLGGLALGARPAMVSQILYLALGVAGLPVFAASPTLAPGALRLLGPTGGYLMAYPFAAFVVGMLAERGSDRRYLSSVVAMLAGLVMVYACGAAWLAFFARTGGLTGIGASLAVSTGVLPFLPADVLKVAAAAGILPGLWRLLGRSTQ
jgi:biotin transport system substrate-specific component